MANKRSKLNLREKDLWYLTGLVSSDGCLSSDGRHINVTSKDFSLLNRVVEVLDLRTKIGIKNKGRVNEAYFIEFSNKDLYDFLVCVGLTPRKSLTIGELSIPDAWAGDFLRGVIDGDGSIRGWAHPTNKVLQWSLRIYSASENYLVWLKFFIERNFLVTGRIHCDEKKPPRVNLYTLKYGKIAAKKILSECYYENALGLDRKIKLAQECCSSSAGWKKSKVLVSAS